MSEWLQGFFVGYGLACLMVLLRMYIIEKKVKNAESSGNTNKDLS